MPPNVDRQCPRCKRTSIYDLADYKPMPIFRGVLKNLTLRETKETREYPVECKRCGHEFIIQYETEGGHDR
jgi:predicted Zn-ribbon and HTH transcriptional regulator